MILGLFTLFGKSDAFAAAAAYATKNPPAGVGTVQKTSLAWGTNSIRTSSNSSGKSGNAQLTIKLVGDAGTQIVRVSLHQSPDGTWQVDSMIPPPASPPDEAPDAPADDPVATPSLSATAATPAPGPSPSAP